MKKVINTINSVIIWTAGSIAGSVILWFIYDHGTVEVRWSTAVLFIIAAVQVFRSK